MRSRAVAAATLALLAGAGCARAGGASPPTSLPRVAFLATTVAPAPTEPPTPPAPPTTVAVVDALRLGEGGLGVARFGDDPDAVVAYVTAAVGRPDDDTDWVGPETDYGTCPGPEARAVRWGWLIAFFADMDALPAPRRAFVGWRYGAAVSGDALYPVGLVTSAGIGNGTPLADVGAAYGVAAAVTRGPAGLKQFVVGSSFRGLADGSGPDGVVTLIEAGAACPA